jgi:hypothetical protein
MTSILTPARGNGPRFVCRVVPRNERGAAFRASIWGFTGVVCYGDGATPALARRMAFANGGTLAALKRVTLATYPDLAEDARAEIANIEYVLRVILEADPQANCANDLLDRGVGRDGVGVDLARS